MPNGRKLIYIPTKGPDDWRGFLAEPDKQWRDGFSAKELAKCWEASNGFPESVKKVFSSSPFPILRDSELLLAIPEHKTDLPGGNRASQSDIFVLARTSEGLAAVVVEGKVNEPFGPLVSEWRSGESSGKIERLQYLCELLGLEPASIENIRYQLLHRTASALIEAERFGAKTAIMLVHSFSATNAWFEDYLAFVRLFGKEAAHGSVIYVGDKNGIGLYLAWVNGIGLK